MMINMFRVVMKKTGNMQKEMVSSSRDMLTIRMNQKEMLEIENTITEQGYYLWTHQ